MSIFSVDLHSLHVTLHHSLCEKGGVFLMIMIMIILHASCELTWLVSTGVGMKEACDMNWVVPSRSRTPSTSLLYSFTGSTFIFSFGSRAS